MSAVRGNLALRLPEGAPFAPEERSALDGILGRASGEQRAWLAGFLAGLAARDGTQRAEPQAAPRAAEPLLILYASESGNAEGVAAKVAANAKRQGFKATIADVADADLAQVARAKNLLVVAATWGEGDPPARAVPFMRALLGEGTPRFEGVRFSVLALGDRAYVNFCATGREIDQRLEALGGVRVAPRVDADLDFAKPAAAWEKQALEALRPATPAEAGAEIIHLDFPQAAPEPAWSRERPFMATVTEQTILSSSRSEKVTAHLELSLEGSGLAFEPGDAMMLVPENAQASVDALLAAAGISADEALAERLRRELDVTTLSRPALETYQALRPQPELESLLAGDGWRGWVEGRQLVDLLEAFPSRLEAEELTRLLRPLPARAYSIASSPLAFPDEAHLLVGLVAYETHGRQRQGVASGHVAQRLAKGQGIGVYLRPNRHFRLPEDGGTPIVMVGPGTGVAPFRGFLQHRREQGATGRSWLFFGEQRFTHDFLYQLEWQELVAEGALTRMDVAFSRDQPEKVYVQHRLWEQRAELWSWLQHGAILYLCGDATRMAKDVDAMLARIAQDQGAMTADQATGWLEDLVRQRRFRKDVY
ncbi:MAG: sulfite reductase flavoprotein subunit alpha [Geminicoccaceae bacterium]